MTDYYGNYHQQQQNQNQNSNYYGYNVNNNSAPSSSYNNQNMNYSTQPQQQQHQNNQHSSGFFSSSSGSSSNSTFAATANTNPTTASLWNPAVASAMASAVTSSNPNSAMFDLGLKAGQTFLDQGTARMIPGLERTMRHLRIYFAVNNDYVKRKMGKVLFSFLYKHWRRIENEPGSKTVYALPISDENAPDLYIPSMSLITYVIICALCYGNSGKFSPEIFSTVTTKCFITQLFEVLLMRVGFYLMNAPISIWDLFSYTGYKYLGLTMNMVVSVLWGLIMGSFSSQKGYYFAFFWTASSCTYFMLKSMANLIPLNTASTGPKREFMVLGLACSQFVTMWFLSQTKLLS